MPRLQLLHQLRKPLAIALLQCRAQTELHQQPGLIGITVLHIQSRVAINELEAAGEENESTFWEGMVGSNAPPMPGLIRLASGGYRRKVAPLMLAAHSGCSIDATAVDRANPRM